MSKPVQTANDQKKDSDSNSSHIFDPLGFFATFTLNKSLNGTSFAERSWLERTVTCRERKQMDADSNVRMQAPYHATNSSHHAHQYGHSDIGATTAKTRRILRVQRVKNLKHEYVFCQTVHVRITVNGRSTKAAIGTAEATILLYVLRLLWSWLDIHMFMHRGYLLGISSWLFDDEFYASSTKFFSIRGSLTFMLIDNGSHAVCWRSESAARGATRLGHWKLRDFCAENGIVW